MENLFNQVGPFSVGGNAMNPFSLSWGTSISLSDLDTIMTVDADTIDMVSSDVVKMQGD
jgi:hypothetical protein